MLPALLYGAQQNQACKLSHSCFYLSVDNQAAEKTRSTSSSKVLSGIPPTLIMWSNRTSSTRAGNQLYPRLSNHLNRKQHVLFAQIATSDSQELRSNFFISKSKLHVHSIMNVNKQTLKKTQQTQGLCAFTKVNGFSFVKL